MKLFWCRNIRKSYTFCVEKAVSAESLQMLQAEHPGRKKQVGNLVHVFRNNKEMSRKLTNLSLSFCLLLKRVKKRLIFFFQMGAVPWITGISKFSFPENARQGTNMPAIFLVLCFLMGFFPLQNSCRFAVFSERSGKKPPKVIGSEMQMASALPRAPRSGGTDWLSGQPAVLLIRPNHLGHRESNISFTSSAFLFDAATYPTQTGLGDLA